MTPDQFVDATEPLPSPREEVLHLHREKISMVIRRRPTAVVRAACATREVERQICEDLVHEQIVIEHIPIGKVVESVPQVREEGDTTILSIVEERVVVLRQLFLKEEVHVRRVKVTAQHVELVRLREQDVIVTRTELSPETAG